jgi:hypothetical protein
MEPAERWLHLPIFDPAAVSTVRCHSSILSTWSDVALESVHSRGARMWLAPSTRS